jgi:DNA-binding HxlR family transcriptional regulator
MRTYGQYCPIARGAEIFAERWTPLIIRNLHLGCGSFSEILQGAPGLPRTLLTERLGQLERRGIVESAPKPHGRGHRYKLTSAGDELFAVCQSLGEWGTRWLDIAPEHLDPYVALWSMCRALRRDRLPDRRIVIRFDFTGRPRPERYWLLIELKDTEICKTCPGRDEDLYITAEAEAFVKWHAACSPRSRRSPVPTQAPQADILDAYSHSGTAIGRHWGPLGQSDHAVALQHDAFIVERAGASYPDVRWPGTDR